MALLSLPVSFLFGCAAQPSPTYPAPVLIVDPSTPYVEPIPELDAHEMDLPAGDLSTPELIEQAFDRDQIDAGQRLLYLAYAIYEYESLPAEFQSEVPWHGTLVVRNLKQAAASAESLCSLDAEVQSELRRLIPESAACSP
jgi:hypothetical protein